MRKFIITILIAIVMLPTAAQSAGGRYVSRMTQDGTIFFLVPKKLNQCNGIKNFEYDMTCLTWSDSVTINWTFKSKDMEFPTDFKIEYCGKSIECTDYSPLYNDIAKGGFEIRVTSKFVVDDISAMLNCHASPVFSFKQNGQLKTAAFSQKAWNSEQKKLKEILSLFNYTRQ